MITLILSDYKASFKQQLKLVYKEGFLLYLYCLVMPVLLFRYTAREEILLLLFVLPMFLSVLLSRMYSNVMNKTFFLSPISKADRLLYYNTALKIRVVIPTALFLCNLCIAALVGELRIGTIIASFVVMLLFAISTNIYTPPIQSSAYAMERKYRLKGNYEVYNVMNQLVGVFSMFLWSLSCDPKESINSWGWGVILSITGIYVLIAVRMIFKFYRQVREINTDYETSKQLIA